MSQLKKFNPYDLPEETLLAISTGRERVLESILATITRNAEGGTVQHLQVVAPRGYGKSFLMRLVQSALKARAAEGKGPPVAVALLPEEQHNVDVPHRLLNEIQRVLENRPAASLLGGAFSESDHAWEDATAALDSAISALLPDGRGIAVAIIENFDQLVDEVFRAPRDQSRLRALLTRPGGRLMLLATATRRIDADYEQRLFHATGLLELAPWKEESCLAFFEKLRGHRQQGPMPQETRAKAQAIAEFIGGSPRMATALAEVLDSNDSLKAAEVLDGLVDELTPYYKHRIESLSRRARTVLDALLRMGEPRTQSEIASEFNTTQARIAEPFKELRLRGEVMGVKASRSAEVLYRVADRLMAHYYRRRHLGASLLEAITEFLTLFYSTDEKLTEVERLRALGRLQEAAHMERLAAADKAPDMSRAPSPGSGGGWLDRLRERVLELAQARKIADAVDLCEQAVHRADTAGDKQDQVRSRRFLGWSLGEMGRHADAADILRHAIAIAEKAGDLDEQAKTTSHLGWSLYQLDQYAEAVDTLRRALALAEKAGDLTIQAEAARILGGSLDEMGQHAEAVNFFRHAIALAEQAGDLTEQVGAIRGLGWSLNRMGQHAEAVDTLHHAIAIAKKAGALTEQAIATRGLGWSLSELGRHAEAVDTLRHAITLAEKTNDVTEVAWAAFELLRAAKAIADDATLIIAWQRAASAAELAPFKTKLPESYLYFDDVIAAALRSGKFGEVWLATRSLENRSIWPLMWAQRKLAEVIAEASQKDGRAAAYALAADWIEVLSQSAAAWVSNDKPSGPEPVAFLRGSIPRLVQQVNDPGLLRDIAALLEQRLPSETTTERALLEAAALRAKRRDDPAALERVDPDIRTALDRVQGVGHTPAPPSPPRRGKRGGTLRRKK